MTPEFMKECLELYKLMIPENFIEMVYRIGNYDGRTQELKRALESIDRLRPDPNDYTIMDKVREESIND